MERSAVSQSFDDNRTLCSKNVHVHVQPTGHPRLPNRGKAVQEAAVGLANQYWPHACSRHGQSHAFTLNVSRAGPVSSKAPT